MDVMDSVATGLVDPAIFERLQASIDGDARVREELRNILQRRERQGSPTPIQRQKNLPLMICRADYPVIAFSCTFGASS